MDLFALAVGVREPDDQAGPLGYWLAQMLSIWESWTEGNATARRLLDAQHADTANRDTCMQTLLATTFELRQRGSEPGVAAALAAAAAICAASLGVPIDQFEAACKQALNADTKAFQALRGYSIQRHHQQCDRLVCIDDLDSVVPGICYGAQICAQQNT